MIGQNQLKIDAKISRLSNFDSITCSVMLPSLVWLGLFSVGTAAQALIPLSNSPNDLETEDKSWTENAIRILWKERNEMGHTPVFRFVYPARPNVEILFKNETATRSGSVKHRYTWMLMMWALIEGHVVEGTEVYEASSGNTAASLAYFCEKIGLNFTAIVPDTIEGIKQKHIEEYGGSVIKVPINDRLLRAQEEADRNDGFFMNQFGNADKAEEFHESGNFTQESANLFHELFMQLEKDDAQLNKVPDHFVHTAGTGGTISSIGRYLKKYDVNTELILADTEFSVYFDLVMYNRFSNESGASLWVQPGMAGTGYGPMGPAKKGKTSSLDPAVIDRVLKVPDLASTAAMRVLRDQGISGGTSAGINFLASLHVAANSSKGTAEKVTIATVLADPAKYYDSSYYNRTWIGENFAPHGGLQVYDCWLRVIESSLVEAKDPLRIGAAECSKNI